MSMPETTSPTIVYLPSRNEASPKQMKNCEFAESGSLERAIPIVALKTGSSRIGAELTVSHTGSLSGTQQLYDALFDRLAPANYMARAVLDVALHDAMGKATRRPVYDLIGGLAQPLIPLEWSISMADDRRKMIADAERALHEFGIKVLCM